MAPASPHGPCQPPELRATSPRALQSHASCVSLACVTTSLLFMEEGRRVPVSPGAAWCPRQQC